MKVRDLHILLTRLDPNAEIDGHHLTILRVKHNSHLVLLPDHEADALLEDAPDFYEKPW